MNESTKTKKALRGSLFALFLCIVLLIGTTFAWFTDTASTGVNKIQAGNLKMKVEYSKDCKTWTEVSSDKPIFDENALWEPGRTETVYVRVTNVGNLALRYDFDIAVESYSPGINADKKSFYLYNYLNFGSADTETAYTDREAAISAVAANDRVLGSKGASVAKEKVLRAGDTSTPTALVLYMPTTVGNEANNVDKNRKPDVVLGVNVNATQATVESDSFGNDYDANAPTIFSPVEYNSGTHEVTESVHADGRWGAVQINGGTTTIKADVHATARDNTAVAVWAASGWKTTGTAIIDSGNFTQDKPGNDTHYDFIYASDGGQIIINGGTFKAATPQWTLNCKDGSGSTITVKGGSFYQFDPSNAQVGAGEIIVPDDYKVVQNGDWYTVVAK